MKKNAERIYGKTNPKRTQSKPNKANFRRARMKVNIYSTTLDENKLADNPQKANNSPIGEKRIIKGDEK